MMFVRGLISSRVWQRSSPLVVPSSISRRAMATRFAFAYSIASGGQIKPVIVASGRISPMTVRASERIALLSSTRMMLGLSLLCSSRWKSILASTPRQADRRGIIVASGRRVPFSHRAIVEWLTKSFFPSCIWERPLSVLSFRRVSAKIVFSRLTPSLYARVFRGRHD